MRHLTLPTLLALTCCGDAEPLLDAGPVVDAGPPPAGERLGLVRLLEQRQDETRWAGFEAVFRDVPDVLPHTLTDEAGDCALYEFAPQSCEPYCEGICTSTNVCEPYPETRSAGPVAITVGAELHTLAPMPPNDSYYGYEESGELFAPGVAITAAAPGAAFDGFTASARGVDDISTALDDGVMTLVPGVDHVVRWTPADGASRVRLTVKSQSSGGHGTPVAALLVCETADAAGQLTVPAAIVDQLPELTAPEICVSVDCPPSELARIGLGYAEVEGGYVLLEAAAAVRFRVRHEP